MTHIHRNSTLLYFRTPAAKKLFTIIFTFLVIAISSASAANRSLPRSTPEKEGVSSRGILNWVDAMDRSGMEFHSYMLVRHGRVIAEGWWKPYAPELKHTMYSVSKSFTATAIGFAVSEKRMSVNDKVVSFFPESLPPAISPYLAALTVKDLLTMSVGQESKVVNFPRNTEVDWVKSFLSLPIADKPGTKFLYNSMGSYMLSAIVQKVTGQREIDYLQPRLFVPLGIRDIDWEVDPMGINAGGWGLRLKTEDMAKFGLLFLQNGMWNGKRLIPKEWIAEATTMKILQSPDMPKEARDTSDWQQGYCYQMWRCRNHAYRGDGAYGQLIVMMPEEDAVAVVTAETTDMQAEINLLWKHLLPALRQVPESMNTGILPNKNRNRAKQSGSISANPHDAAALRKKAASLFLHPPIQDETIESDMKLSGRTFRMESNTQGIRSLSFVTGSGRITATLTTDTAEFPFTFGTGAWIGGTTDRRGPNLVNAIGNNSHLAPFKVVGSARWKDGSTLELTLRYIESPHTETFLCTFKDNSVSVVTCNSLDHGMKKETIVGKSI